MALDKKVLSRLANTIEEHSEKLDGIHDQLTDMVSDNGNEMDSVDDAAGDLQEGIDKLDDVVKALREFAK